MPDYDLKKLIQCAKALTRVETFAFDLETSGLDPHTDKIIGVGLSTETRAWYFKTVGQNPYPLSVLKQHLNPVLLDTDKLCCAHNVKFDLEFMRAVRWPVNNRICDTMVLAHILDDNRAGSGRLALKGKGGLVDELFDIVLDTYQQSALAGGLFSKPEEDYACDDVLYTFKCYKKLISQLNRYPEIKKFFWEVSMPMVRVLADMEYTGMYVDVDYLLTYEESIQEEADILLKQIHEAAGYPLQIGSTEQLSRYLFDDEEGPKLKPKFFMQRGKKGFYSTAESVLSHFTKDHPIPQLVLDWRSKNKLISTYIKPFIKRAESSSESRIYTTLSQTGTVTARLSSSDPNLQNIPRPQKGAKYSMRHAFSAPPGKKLVVADYGQLELRIMAHQSRDKTMMEIYQTGGDIHHMTTVALGLEDHNDGRPIAKGCNFGLTYGLSPQGLKDDLWKKARIDKSLEECQRWRYNFFSRYPGIAQYHLKVENFLKKHGYVLTLTGRRRRLHELMARDFNQSLRMAINSTIQGSAADIVSIAMRNFQRTIELKRMKEPLWDHVFILLQVHDEVIAEAPEAIAEEVAKTLEHDMVNAVKLRVPLIADPGVADTWGDAK